MKNELLEKLNIKISNDLGVEKLKITYTVSEKAVSKFGHCKYVDYKHYLINLSSFILGTELEKDTISHELCHAYDHHYFKSLPGSLDSKSHGVAWKMLMDKVFGYVNVKAQGIHKSNSKSNELVDKGNNMFDLYVSGDKKAMFKLTDTTLSIRTPQNKFFENILEEEKYMDVFTGFYQKMLK